MQSRKSKHNPLISLAAKQQHLRHTDHEDVDYMIAHGITTKINSNHLTIGSLHFMMEHHGIDFAAHQKTIDHLEAKRLYVKQLALNLKFVRLISNFFSITIK